MTTTTLKTGEAAAYLGMSPNSLRSWIRRYGFPQPGRTEGGHQRFDLGELEELRCALDAGLRGESAVRAAEARSRNQRLRLPTLLAAGRFREAERELAEQAMLAGPDMVADHALDVINQIVAARGGQDATTAIAGRVLATAFERVGHLQATDPAAPQLLVLEVVDGPVEWVRSAVVRFSARSHGWWPIVVRLDATEGLEALVRRSPGAALVCLAPGEQPDATARLCARLRRVAPEMRIVLDHGEHPLDLVRRLRDPNALPAARRDQARPPRDAHAHGVPARPLSSPALHAVT